MATANQLIVEYMENRQVIDMSYNTGLTDTKIEEVIAEAEDRIHEERMRAIRWEYDADVREDQNIIRIMLRVLADRQERADKLNEKRRAWEAAQTETEEVTTMSNGNMTIDTIERLSDSTIAQWGGSELHAAQRFLANQSRAAFDHGDDAHERRCDAQLDRIDRIHV